jgi:potassium/chloride transporter 9
MGVIGSAKLLQALARDHLVPGLSVFGKGTRTTDEPIYAIFFTYILAQLTMFADINQIASFITMTVSCVLIPCLGSWDGDCSYARPFMY